MLTVCTLLYNKYLEFFILQNWNSVSMEHLLFPPPHWPWQPPFHLMFLRVWLFQVPHVSEIVQCLACSFAACLFYLNTVLKGHLHCHKWQSFLFLRPDNVLLYVYVTFYLPIFLLTDIEGASVSRLLWVKLQWTLSAHISLQDSVFNSGRFIPQSGLLDHVIILFLIFWGTSVLVFIVVAPFYTLTKSTQGFLLLSIRANTCYFLCLV